MRNISDQALAAATRRLMSSGKLPETVIMESIREEIAETERLLYMLRNGREPFVPEVAEVVAPPVRRRMTKADKERAESRKLQGAYLALIRQFPKSKRAVFSRLAKEISRERAIRDMKRELKSPGSVIEKRKRPDRRKAPAPNRPAKSARPNDNRTVDANAAARTARNAADAARRLESKAATGGANVTT